MMESPFSIALSPHVICCRSKSQVINLPRGGGVLPNFQYGGGSVPLFLC